MPEAVQSLQKSVHSKKKVVMHARKFLYKPRMIFSLLVKLVNVEILKF